ncbi:LOW QUALITY PROTEIN: hypothetical protein RJ641_035434 [Dillenia turbinata]|uniref:Uncharacterized protein n=1 Tax=Dillenia turbinata TaxID=194707 RepID=A0AAN8ZCC1_9MAGN
MHRQKLHISILSSSTISFPRESYPLFLRLLYICARKSSNHLHHSSILPLRLSLTFSLYNMMDIRALPSSLCSPSWRLFFGSCGFFKPSKNLLGVSLQAFGERLLRVVPKVLAGIGYALSSSENTHVIMMMNFLMEVWGKDVEPSQSVPHGLMLLHLFEWFSFFRENRDFLPRKVTCFKPNNVPFAVVTAAAGVLRGISRAKNPGSVSEIISRLRGSSEEQIEALARVLNIKIGQNHDNNPGNRPLLKICPLSFRVQVLVCLALALLTEIFPLRRFYATSHDKPNSDLSNLWHGMIKEHLGSVLCKEAGFVTGVFCKQYVSADEEHKIFVENLMWEYCQEVYRGHQQIAILHDHKENLLGNLEKIAESAFLMVIVFALAVTKHKVNSKYTTETQMDFSILISFSCVEYFRRMWLPEYTDTIRAVVVNIQENLFACVSFIEAMPSYADFTNPQGLKSDYVCSKDEVQTARILFYLHVIATCIYCLRHPVFRRVVAPIIYIGHPNAKVARASHSVFAAFISSRKDSPQDEKGCPGVTPFDGMASGVAALLRHLPAESPATFFCMNSLVEKTNGLCCEAMILDADAWKNWQQESEPCKKMLELLLRHIYLVDMQVLPNLMKLLAKLIVQLPKDGQSMVLNEIYAQAAESDDVTWKSTLVSWAQSLSYLCTQAAGAGKNAGTSAVKSGDDIIARNEDALSLDRLSARLQESSYSPLCTTKNVSLLPSVAVYVKR